MRKITSIIITIMFVISTFAFAAIGTGAEAAVGIGSVAADYTPAADATAIETAEQFAAMATDGNYYLAADITLTATYEEAFTGTLDGNGHTLTVSAPVFKTLSGTVKNLKLAGAVTFTGRVGALVVNISGAATVENVANAATVTNNGEADEPTGGIIGKINNSKYNAVVVIKNCYNSAVITGPEAVGGIIGESQADTTAPEIIGCVNDGEINSILFDQSGGASGGIMGYSGTGNVKYNDCVNNGKINALYRAGGIIGDARKSAHIFNCTNNGEIIGYQQAAGIVAYACDKSTTTPLIIDGCVNNGRIDALKYTNEDKTAYANTGDAAGILANVGSSGGTVGKYSVINCINTAEISGGYRVGGLVGYCYGSGEKQYLSLENCINLGNIKSVRFASNFVAYTNSPNTTLKNCVGGGELTLLPFEDTVGRRVIFGCSTSNIALCPIENVFLCDGGTTDWFTWASDEANAKNRIALSYVVGKDLTNYQYPTYDEAGAETMNDFTFEEGATVNVKAVTQTETVNDEFVSAVNTAFGKTVLYNNNGKLSLDAPAVGPVVPVDPTIPETGDDTALIIAALVISVSAVFALALIPSKKFNI